MRTFKNFPPESMCPICGTHDDGPCVLIQIDNTGDGSIAEAIPVHSWCMETASNFRYNKETGVIYVRTKQ